MKCALIYDDMETLACFENLNTKKKTNKASLKKLLHES